MARPMQGLELSRGEFDVLSEVQRGTKGTLRKAFYDEGNGRKAIAAKLLWRGLVELTGERYDRIQVSPLGLKALSQSKF